MEVRSKPALIFSTKAASTTAQTWVTGVTRTEQESTGCAKPCEITVEANLYYFTLVTSILYSLLELSYWWYIWYNNNTEMTNLWTDTPQPSAPQLPILLSGSTITRGHRELNQKHVSVSLSPAQTPHLFDVSHPVPCLILSSPVASTKWNANRPA